MGRAVISLYEMRPSLGCERAVGSLPSSADERPCCPGAFSGGQRVRNGVLRPADHTACRVLFGFSTMQAVM